MNNLKELGLEVLSVEEMSTIRGGYQLIWDNGQGYGKGRDDGERLVSTPRITVR